MTDTDPQHSHEDAFSRPQDYGELNNELWNDKCDYMDLKECTNLNPNNYNLIVMHLNICSLLAHQQELC